MCKNKNEMIHSNIKKKKENLIRHLSCGADGDNSLANRLTTTAIINNSYEIITPLDT